MTASHTIENFYKTIEKKIDVSKPSYISKIAEETFDILNNKEEIKITDNMKKDLHKYETILSASCTQINTLLENTADTKEQLEESLDEINQQFQIHETIKNLTNRKQQIEAQINNKKRETINKSTINEIKKTVTRDEKSKIIQQEKRVQQAQQSVNERSKKIQEKPKKTESTLILTKKEQRQRKESIKKQEENYEINKEEQNKSKQELKKQKNILYQQYTEYNDRRHKNKLQKIIDQIQKEKNKVSSNNKENIKKKDQTIKHLNKIQKSFNNIEKIRQDFVKQKFTLEVFNKKLQNINTHQPSIQKINKETGDQLNIHTQLYKKNYNNEHHTLNILDHNQQAIQIKTWRITTQHKTTIDGQEAIIDVSFPDPNKTDGIIQEKDIIITHKKQPLLEQDYPIDIILPVQINIKEEINDPNTTMDGTNITHTQHIPIQIGYESFLQREKKQLINQQLEETTTKKNIKQTVEHHLTNKWLSIIQQNKETYNLTTPQLLTLEEQRSSLCPIVTQKCYEKITTKNNAILTQQIIEEDTIQTLKQGTQEQLNKAITKIIEWLTKEDEIDPLYQQIFDQTLPTILEKELTKNKTNNNEKETNEYRESIAKIPMEVFLDKQEAIDIWHGYSLVRLDQSGLSIWWIMSGITKKWKYAIRKIDNEGKTLQLYPDWRKKIHNTTKKQIQEWYLQQWQHIRETGNKRKNTMNQTKDSAKEILSESKNKINQEVSITPRAWKLQSTMKTLHKIKNTTHGLLKGSWWTTKYLWSMVGWLTARIVKTYGYMQWGLWAINNTKNTLYHRTRKETNRIINGETIGDIIYNPIFLNEYPGDFQEIFEQMTTNQLRTKLLQQNSKRENWSDRPQVQFTTDGDISYYVRITNGDNGDNIYECGEFKTPGGDHNTMSEKEFLEYTSRQSTKHTSYGEIPDMTNETEKDTYQYKKLFQDKKKHKIVMALCQWVNTMNTQHTYQKIKNWMKYYKDPQRKELKKTRKKRNKIQQHLNKTSKKTRMKKQQNEISEEIMAKNKEIQEFTEKAQKEQKQIDNITQKNEQLQAEIDKADINIKTITAIINKIENKPSIKKFFTKWSKEYKKNLTIETNIESLSKEYQQFKLTLQKKSQQDKTQNQQEIENYINQYKNIIKNKIATTSQEIDKRQEEINNDKSLSKKQKAKDKDEIEKIKQYLKKLQ